MLTEMHHRFVQMCIYVLSVFVVIDSSGALSAQACSPPLRYGRSLASWIVRNRAGEFWGRLWGHTRSRQNRKGGEIEISDRNDNQKDGKVRQSDGGDERRK